MRCAGESSSIAKDNVSYGAAAFSTREANYKQQITQRHTRRTQPGPTALLSASDRGTALSASHAGSACGALSRPRAHSHGAGAAGAAGTAGSAAPKYHATQLL